MKNNCLLLRTVFYLQIVIHGVAVSITQSTPSIVFKNRATLNVPEAFKSKEQKIPGQSITFLFANYNYLKKRIAFLLEQVLFKTFLREYHFYSGIASFLASLTSLFLTPQAANRKKKIVRVAFVPGWILSYFSIISRRSYE